MAIEMLEVIYQVHGLKVERCKEECYEILVTCFLQETQTRGFHDRESDSVIG